MPFRTHDIALGGTYRHSLNSDNFIGAFVSFYARPYGKAILLKSGPNFYFQLKEYRYVTAVGLDKKIWINNHYDVFFGGGVGLALVDYRGTGTGVYRGHKIVKKEGLTPLAQAGVSYKFNRWILIRIGGQYMDMKTTKSFRTYAVAGGQF